MGACNNHNGCSLPSSAGTGETRVRIWVTHLMMSCVRYEVQFWMEEVRGVSWD